MGGVVAIRRRKGQLLAMIRGWGHWYPVESVTIEVLFTMPSRMTLENVGPSKVNKKVANKHQASVRYNVNV